MHERILNKSCCGQCARCHTRGITEGIKHKPREECQQHVAYTAGIQGSTQQYHNTQQGYGIIPQDYVVEHKNLKKDDQEHKTQSME